MPKFALKECDVMQFESRPYQKNGETRQARSLLAKYQGKFFMFSVARDANVDELKGAEGKTVDLIVEMSTFGKELDPSFAVLGVAE